MRRASEMHHIGEIFQIRAERSRIDCQGEQTFPGQVPMSAYPSKADIRQRARHIRFVLTAAKEQRHPIASSVN